jgi:hypothetical protein
VGYCLNHTPNHHYLLCVRARPGAGGGGGGPHAKLALIT